jgi:hypothetical protein
MPLGQSNDIGNTLQRRVPSVLPSRGREYTRQLWRFSEGKVLPMSLDHGSRVLAMTSLPSRTSLVPVYQNRVEGSGSSFRRNAETSTRDARAPQSSRVRELITDFRDL